jgi:hypothetical protein
MKRTRFQELDLTSVRTYSAQGRDSKVDAGQSAKRISSGMRVQELLQALPNVLKANELKEVAERIVQARIAGRPVIAMLGGHVIKTGCGLILADLVERGVLTHVAANGSVAIHDSELALFGRTSEDVAEQLRDGSFGMARETADMVNSAADLAAGESIGFGQALGELIHKRSADCAGHSLLARCSALGVPCTLHVAMGTDIVHQHPSANGASIGEASLRDFRILAATVSRLGDRGMVLNFGSAVLMPEVFLKALSVARNLGHSAAGFSTANFDMIQHYRPGVNVLSRPVEGRGKGYAISGHHEIMIPLLAAAVLEEADACGEPFVSG